MHELNKETEEKKIEIKERPINVLRVRCICGHRRATRLEDPKNIKMAHWYCEDCGRIIRQ